MAVMPDTTMDEIIALARKYAIAQEQFDEIATEIEDAQRALIRSRQRALRNRAADAASAREALEAKMAAHPELFESPRTHAVAGVKFGFRRQAKKLVVHDEQATIRAIEERLPDQAPLLVKTTKKLVRASAAKLEPVEQARLGLETDPAKDVVTIAMASTDLDKLVRALTVDITEATEDAE